MGKIDELYELYCRRDLERIEKDKMLDLATPEEVRQARKDVEEEFKIRLDTIDNSIATLEASIKADVLSTGESVGNDNLQAVFTPGRVSWDTRMLEGMIAMVP